MMAGKFVETRSSLTMPCLGWLFVLIWTWDLSILICDAEFGAVAWRDLGCGVLMLGWVDFLVVEPESLILAQSERWRQA